MCKAKKLSDERKDLLVNIGFVWSERQSSKTSREQTSWDERFEGACQLQCNLFFYFLLIVMSHALSPQSSKSSSPFMVIVKFPEQEKMLLSDGG